jgi:phosphoribosylformylglycinamidine cyclo-ligase
LARSALLEVGGRRLDAPAWEGASRSLGEELLEPSVIYAPAVVRLLLSLGTDVHAVAHITGGGLAGNLPRVLPPGLGAVVRRGSWPVPRIFDEVQRAGAVGDEEMGRVFNLGIGMVVAVAADRVSDAVGLLGSASARASAGAGAGVEVGVAVIGEVVAGASGVTLV